jgi:hypothetical protein
MKKIFLVLFLLVATGTVTEAHKYWHRHRNVIITFQTFYDDLSPYGDWIYTPDYGYVWQPYFDSPHNFRPYSSNGYWVNTMSGWTWVSDYPWGWATFHYGRWYFDDYAGWLWIPGYEWAPAWVTWGNYGDYYGWAPLGPHINVSINFNWFAPDPWWTFVPRRHFCSHHWHQYIYDRPVQVNHITYINNIYTDNDDRRRGSTWFYGPRITDVERHTNSRVKQMRIVDNDRPGNVRVNNDQVAMYRPGVDQTRSNTRPAQYRNMKEDRKNGTVIRQNSRSNDPGSYRKRSVETETDRKSIQNEYPGRTGNVPSPRNEERKNVNPGTYNRGNASDVNRNPRNEGKEKETPVINQNRERRNEPAKSGNEYRNSRPDNNEKSVKPKVSESRKEPSFNNRQQESSAKKENKKQDTRGSQSKSRTPDKPKSSEHSTSKRR